MINLGPQDMWHSLCVVSSKACVIEINVRLDSNDDERDAPCVEAMFVRMIPHDGG
jgi:hypothetical protein